jgi:hypothetical protein
MAEPFLVYLKRNGHVEDCAPMLDSDHPSGGEASAVANPVHGVEYRYLAVTGAKKVAVQGMGVAFLGYRPGRSHQCLAETTWPP